MMKHVVIFSIALLMAGSQATQAGWQTTDTVNELVLSFDFLNRDIGLSAGSKNLVGPRILKTTDGGYGWTPMLFGTPNMAILDVGWEDDNVIYACGAGGLTLINSILKSTDAGSTWNSVWANSMFSYWTDIQIIKPDYVIATGYYTRMLETIYGIVYTKNGGNSWDLLNWSWNTWPDVAWPTDICFLDENFGFAAGGRWPWVDRSTNHPRLPAPGFRASASQDSTPDLWWAMAEKTTDGGKSWATIFYEHEFALSDIFFINKNQGWITGYFNPTVNNSDYTYMGRIYHTTNGGATWKQQYYGYENSVQMSAIYMFNRREGWVVGNSGAATKRSYQFHTINGGDTWELDNFHENADPWEVKFFDESEGWAVGPNAYQMSKFIHFTDSSRIPKFNFKIVESPVSASPGSTLKWKVYCKNLSGLNQSGDIWVSVTGPKLGKLSPYPVLIMENVTIPKGFTTTRNMSIELPSNMPIGTYNFETIIGPYDNQNPNEILAYAGFDVDVK